MAGQFLGVLFSHPADFTPVCTTELGTVAKIKAELKSETQGDGGQRGSVGKAPRLD